MSLVWYGDGLPAYIMHRVAHRVTPRYGVSRESLLHSTEGRCECRTPEGSSELSQQQPQQHGPVRSPIAVRATCGQELCEGGFDVEIHIAF